MKTSWELSDRFGFERISLPDDYTKNFDLLYSIADSEGLKTKEGNDAAEFLHSVRLEPPE